MNILRNPQNGNMFVNSIFYLLQDICIDTDMYVCMYIYNIHIHVYNIYMHIYIYSWYIYIYIHKYAPEVMVYDTTWYSITCIWHNTHTHSIKYIYMILANKYVLCIDLLMYRIFVYGCMIALWVLQWHSYLRSAGLSTPPEKLKVWGIH